jgi:hypothetical protein
MLSCVTLGIILREPLDDILRGLPSGTRGCSQNPESGLGALCPIPNLH